MDMYRSGRFFLTSVTIASTLIGAMGCGASHDDAEHATAEHATSSHDTHNGHMPTATTECAISENGGIVITDGWVRAARTANTTSGAFISICNQADRADALIGVQFDGAKTAEFHQTITKEDGLTGMQPIEQFDIAAGSSLALEPGGGHIMLIGLTEDIAEGDSPTVTLNFANAGEIETSLTVKSLANAHDH